jgi:hypothetical protein
MSRYVDVDAFLEDNKEFADREIEHPRYQETVRELIDEAPSIDIVRCKECKHRPIKEDANEEDYGFNVIAPNEDERCPCLVEDGWYSWIPKDDFYCGYGEREGE